MANFEDENGEDDAGAMRDACARVEKMPWMQNDLLFYFNQVEIKMQSCGVKKNYTKFQVLTGALPAHVIEQVKPLLRKQQTDFPQNDAYKQLKSTILRIFGPKPCANIERALTRVLTGPPSSLARALADDICKKQLDCECCPAIVEALWKRQLSSQVKAGIAHTTLSKDTFEDVLQLADNIWETQPGAAASVAAIVGDQSANPLDETQPGLQYPVPSVSAISRGRGRGGRGRGRARGSRGNGQSRPSSSGTQSQATGSARFRGPKHPDLPAGDWKGCGLHFRWGRQAHFCSEPATCPWKDIFTPKPQQN